MNDRSDGSPDGAMANRAGTARLTFAVLLRANRIVLTGGLAVAVFVAFVLTVTTLDPSLVQELESGDMIDTMFSTMISVVLTGTTLVVSIGQLVLTQETGPLGDQRGRMANAMDFRDFTRELTGRPVPTDPARFLGDLVDATITRSRALREGVAGGTDGVVREDLDEFAGAVIGNARAVNEQLDGAQFGTFDVLSAALNFDYSWKIARIEGLQDEYAAELGDGDHERLEELKTALSLFGPAREHVKTLYFQWELISLSRQILYAAILAVIVASVMVAVVSPETAPGSLFGIDRIVLLVGAAFAVTLLPFLLFVSYILRILTVAKRTLAMGPLVLQE